MPLKTPRSRLQDVRGQQALTEDVKWLNRIVSAGTLVVVSVVVLKWLGTATFKWQGISFSVRDTWIVLLLMTVVHAYVAVLVVRSAHRVWGEATDQQRRKIYDSLSAKGNALIRGIVPQIVAKRGGAAPRRLMSLDDPTTWVSYVLAVTFVAAIVPVPNSLEAVSRDLPFWLTAILLLWANWRIAANWIVAITELSLPGDQAFYHHFLDESYPRGMKRFIGAATSGPGPAGFYLSILLLVVFLGLDILLVIFYFVGSNVISVLAKYLVLLVALFVLTLNVDFSGLAQKMRARAQKDGEVEDTMAWRVYDIFLVPAWLFFIPAGLLWAYDSYRSIDAIRAWFRMHGF